MSEQDAKMVKRLDALLLEEGPETPAQVRERLEREGVNVKAIVERVKANAGAAYREILAENAKQRKVEKAGTIGSIFGNLANLKREQLINLLRDAANGAFGSAVMARCRNQDAENLSEEDLRTLLQDIESTL
jgi:hypothetical protein